MGKFLLHFHGDENSAQRLLFNIQQQSGSNAFYIDPVTFYTLTGAMTDCRHIVFESEGAKDNFEALKIFASEDLGMDEVSIEEIKSPDNDEFAGGANFEDVFATLPFESGIFITLVMVPPGFGDLKEGNSSLEATS